MGETNQLFEGGTDPVVDWRSTTVVPGELASPGIAVARGPGAQRLVVWSSRENGAGAEVWSSAGPDKTLPPARVLYTPAAGRLVVHRAADLPAER